jgi:hypothetical protein
VQQWQRYPIAQDFLNRYQWAVCSGRLRHFAALRQNSAPERPSFSFPLLGIDWWLAGKNWW